MLALWELDGIHRLIAYSHPTAVQQNSYGHYQAGKEWSQIPTQKMSVFYNQLSELHVGFYSTKAFRDTLVWKWKSANLRYVSARLVYHTHFIYLHQNTPSKMMLELPLTLFTTGK